MHLGSHFAIRPQVGEDLVTVLDQLRIKHVIGLGDGAGANIMARFAMMHGMSDSFLLSDRHFFGGGFRNYFI